MMMIELLWRNLGSKIEAQMGQEGVVYLFGIKRILKSCVIYGIYLFYSDEAILKQFIIKIIGILIWVLNYLNLFD